MPRKPTKVLVVAAWDPELRRIRERDDAGSLLTAAIGVGLVEAGIGMTRCIETHRPDLAFLVGTCGALHPLPTGAVVVASQIRLVEASVLAGEAELPAPMPVEAAPPKHLHDVLVEAGARSVQIANTIGITITDAHAARLAREAYEIEHLEAFAFARACASANVPCAIVLAVANAVGAAGRGEWRANHDAASARAGDTLYDALPALIKTSTRTPLPGRA